MTTSTRIGDLLCAAGELEPNELARLLKLQESSPARPLGVLAEEHAGVDPAAVEAAWAAAHVASVRAHRRPTTDLQCEYWAS